MEELHDTVSRLHHDRDLVQRSTASPSDRHAREANLRDGADGDQVATGLTPQLLHGAVKQMDTDRYLLQKVVVCLGKMVCMRDVSFRSLQNKCCKLG